MEKRGGQPATALSGVRVRYGRIPPLSRVSRNPEHEQE
jgi:hypothetical protein